MAGNSLSDINYNKETEEFRNPRVTVHRALTTYNRYLKNESKTLKIQFLKCADSLISRLVIKRNFGVWPYYYLFWRAQMYGCKIPWVSALIQGQGIRAVIKAYTLTENEKYFAAAKYALGAFSIPIRDGGVLSIDENDNDWWYEEYACVHSKPSGVLNGFISALLGIHDFYLLITTASQSNSLTKEY